MSKNNRKKRADCAFGVHFDLHANLTDRSHVGEKFDPSSVEEFIRRVKPDYLQCDTKGHYGLSAYPTKVGAHVELAGGVDILRSWRELAEQYGVGLYAHHSGVFDIDAVEKHPEWSALNEQREIISSGDTYPPQHYISVFGPYADELLIPQLIEIANDYGLDGCWIDGDCWANQPDFSVWAEKAYREKYGKPLPKYGEPDYHEFSNFIRQGFRDYVNHYTKELHRAAPGFQVASNWMYTCMMPEKPDDELDYISGDFFGLDGPNFGRFAARCLSNHGKPWDLMAWSVMPGPEYLFGGDNGHHKEAIQLCQEAAVVLALGGGFEYCGMQRNGGIERFVIDKAVTTAEFFRARQPFCFKAKHVPQAAVIFSTAAAYCDDNPTFRHNTEAADCTYGTLLAALDNQYSTEILITYQALERDLSAYGLIILPEVAELEPALKDKLIAYARDGGSLIVAGPQSTRLFSEQLGVEIGPGNEKEEYIHAVESSGFFASLYTKYCIAGKVAGDTEVLNGFYPRNYPLTYSAGSDGDTPLVAATVREFGQGKIAGVYFDMGPYRHLKSAALRRLFGGVMERMFPEPAVKLRGSHLVDVSLMEKDGTLCVNLTNMGGQAFSAVDKTFDELPPLCGLEVEIAFDRQPAEVYIEPGHTVPEYTYQDGRISLGIERLDVHCVITVE